MAAHAHHDHGDRPDAGVASPPDSEVAGLQLRAKCTCGCSKGAASAGTTTSPRVGFALLSAPPERLLEIAPPFDVWLIERVPASQADAFDHVPILS